MTLHRYAVGAWLLVCVLTALAYLPALDGAFVSDDRPLVEINPHLRDPASISRFFTHGAWASSGLELAGDRVYRPGFLLWLFAIHQTFGADPFAFHLAALLVHCLNAGLVLLLALRLCPRCGIAGAALAASVFALQPVQSEVVAWIAGGTDALLAVFVLSALLAWLKYRDGGGLAAGAVATLALIAALLTKETAVAAPLAVLVLDRLLPPARRRLWPAFVLMALIVVAYLLIRAAALEADSALGLTQQGLARFAQYTLLAGRYTLAPWPLPFWFNDPLAGIASTTDLVVGLSALTLAGLAAWRVPAARFALGWAVLLLLPPLAIAFIDSGAFALRFLYLPMAGIAWAVVAVLVPRAPRPAWVSATLVLVLACAVLVRTAVADYRDEVAFFSRVVRSDPQSPVGPTGLAKFHLRRGDPKAALAVYSDALERVRAPESRSPLIESQALLLARLGRYQESLDAYASLLSSPTNAGLGHLGMANNLWAMGRLQEALAAYQRATAADPDLFHAHYNLAVLSAQLGRMDLAIAAYRKVLELPTSRDRRQPQQRARAFLMRRGALQ